MNRTIVYPNQNPLETDILNANKDAYLALSKAMESLLGTSAAATGLSCVPTVPASLNVVLKPGCVYQMQPLDSTPYSTLGTDAHNVLKQGISLDDVQVSCPAPSNAGYSVNYLVQAQVLETDGGDSVLPYYNSANPNVSFNGPANTGTSQKTRRMDTCNITVKAGVAAPSGSQTTPTVDSGFMPLYVVTVAYGQTAIISDNIVQHGSANIIPPLATVSSTAGAALPAASYTAADVLTKIKTVDGAGSGLDADTLDGNEASAFAMVAAFANSKAAPGYQKLPGGLILQWGAVSSDTVGNGATNSNTVTFPIAFPTACLTGFASFVTPEGGCSVGFTLVNSTTAHVQHANLSGSTKTLSSTYLAIGY